MTQLMTGAAGDAWRRWRRDRETILAIAGPFLFLPMLAWLLLVPEPVVPAGASVEVIRSIQLQWGVEHLHWLAARIGFELFATVAILSLYLARDHRTVGGALRRALTTLPMFLIAVMASWGLVTLGVLAFVVPGMYVYGRVALTGPVMVAEPGVGVFAAVQRSIELTRGNGWRVFALLATALVAGVVALQLVGGVDQAMRGSGAANPVARVIVDTLAALAATGSVLARILFQVALYRTLARPRHRI